MTDTTTTTADFQSAKTFASAPDTVFSALTDIDALTGWWCPAGGGAGEGETLRFLMGDQEVVMPVVVADRPSRVRWRVPVCEPIADWVRTSITFDLEPVGAGTELRFTHHGPEVGLECFAMCSAAWTKYLASPVDFVDRGVGASVPLNDVENFAVWSARHTAH